MAPEGRRSQDRFPPSPDFSFRFFISSSDGKFQTSPDSLMEITKKKKASLMEPFFRKKFGYFCDYVQRKGGFCKKHAMLAPDGRAPPVRFGVSAGEASDFATWVFFCHGLGKI